MSYNEFKNEIREFLEMAYEGKQVKIFEVVKNNGVKLHGLTIADETEQVTPTIYLNEYYKEYCSGKTLEIILKEISELYEVYSQKEPIDAEAFQSFDTMKKLMFFKLINWEKNEELLRQVPHMPFGDLAIVFYILLTSEELGSSTILIYNSHLEMWDKDVETVYQTARENTLEQLGCELKTIFETMQELFIENLEREFGIPIDEDALNEEDSQLKEFIHNEVKTHTKYADELPMHVLTNKMRLYGAACILYDEVLEMCETELSGGYYILPSSIHEVILVREKDVDETGSLSEMVTEINNTHVEAEEVLSDQVYFYSKKTGLKTGL